MMCHSIIITYLYKISRLHCFSEFIINKNYILEYWLNLFFMCDKTMTTVGIPTDVKQLSLFICDTR